MEVFIIVKSDAWADKFAEYFASRVPVNIGDNHYVVNFEDKEKGAVEAMLAECGLVLLDITETEAIAAIERIEQGAFYLTQAQAQAVSAHFSPKEVVI